MITYVGAHWQNGSTDVLNCAVDRCECFQKLSYEEWNSPPFQHVSTSWSIYKHPSEMLSDSDTRTKLTSIFWRVLEFVKNMPPDSIISQSVEPAQRSASPHVFLGASLELMVYVCIHPCLWVHKRQRHGDLVSIYMLPTQIQL